MGYYSTIEIELDPISFKEGALSKKMLEDFEKDFHFESFMNSFQPEVRFYSVKADAVVIDGGINLQVPDDKIYVSRLIFNHYGEEGSYYDLEVCLEKAAELLNDLSLEPLTGHVTRYGEDEGDIVRYFIYESGKVTAKQAIISFD